MIGEINMIIAVGRKGEKMNDDTISRQAAIETVEKWFFNFDDNRMPKEVLLEMPSAQRTTCKYWDTESDFCALYRPSAQPEIIRCKDCKHRMVNAHFGKREYISLKAMCELDTGDPFELGRCAENGDWYCADAERRTDETD